MMQWRKQPTTNSQVRVYSRNQSPEAKQCSDQHCRRVQWSLLVIPQSNTGRPQISIFDQSWRTPSKQPRHRFHRDQPSLTTFHQNYTFSDSGPMSPDITSLSNLLVCWVVPDLCLPPVKKKQLSIQWTDVNILHHLVGSMPIALGQVHEMDILEA